MNHMTDHVAILSTQTSNKNLRRENTTQSNSQKTRGILPTICEQVKSLSTRLKLHSITEQSKAGTVEQCSKLIDTIIVTSEFVSAAPKPNFQQSQQYTYILVFKQLSTQVHFRHNNMKVTSKALSPLGLGLVSI